MLIIFVYGFSTITKNTFKEESSTLIKLHQQSQTMYTAMLTRIPGLVHVMTPPSLGMFLCACSY
jgi:hypothetical protein